MTDNRSSYRQIMKATSLFGGVQVFNIIISIIKSKFVAVFLGPSGMGIFGLLISTTELIKGLTNFGLGISGVKTIASANATNNQEKIASVVISFRRWIWITGFLGTLITLVLSHWLSILTFGNSNYTLAFVWLSLTILFSQLSTGSLTILQGMRKLQYLAKANVAGNAIGLFITIPLYYWYRIDAIVPVLIVSSIISLSIIRYFTKKVKIEHIRVTKAKTIAEGKQMLIMGYILSIGPLLAVGSSYIVRTYIGKQGGLADVGLYAAGFAILNTYVGLIFNAMLTDYYPRLAAVAHNNSLCKEVVNQQTEIALLILGPMLIVFLIFINWIIILLYSKEFLGINDMMYWAALSIFFKLFNWSLGLILIAKGTSKLYFWSDLIANLYILVLNLIGYHFWGLAGLGISFLVGYFFSYLQLFFISKIKFKFSFAPGLYRIFIIQFVLAVSSFFAVKFLSSPYLYLVGGGVIIISSWHSYNELDKRIGIKSLIFDVFQKFR